MKKQTKTARNMFEWHNHKLAKRAERKAKKQLAFLNKLKEKAENPSDRKIRLRAHNALEFAENQKQIAAIGVNPKYMSSAQRLFAGIYGDYQKDYELKEEEYKKKLNQERVDKYRAEHPEAAVMRRSI